MLLVGGNIRTKGTEGIFRNGKQKIKKDRSDINFMFLLSFLPLCFFCSGYDRAYQILPSGVGSMTSTGRPVAAESRVRRLATASARARRT